MVTYGNYGEHMNMTDIAIENGNLQYKNVIFHSYVSLSDGIFSCGTIKFYEMRISINSIQLHIRRFEIVQLLRTYGHMDMVGNLLELQGFCEDALMIRGQG